jgi:hypothetical protein
LFLFVVCCGFGGFEKVFVVLCCVVLCCVVLCCVVLCCVVLCCVVCCVVLCCVFRIVRAERCRRLFPSSTTPPPGPSRPALGRLKSSALRTANRLVATMSSPWNNRYSQCALALPAPPSFSKGTASSLSQPNCLRASATTVGDTTAAVLLRTRARSDDVRGLYTCMSLPFSCVSAAQVDKNTTLKKRPLKRCHYTTLATTTLLTGRRRR